MAISGLFVLGTLVTRPVLVAQWNPFALIEAYETLITLPVMVAQWIGILGLRHIGRSGAWWSMTAGVILSTLGFVTSFFGAFSGGNGSDYHALIITSAVSALGSLLFAIGFAMHGLRASRSAQRMQELEQLTAAMSEEINQLRDKAAQAP